MAGDTFRRKTRTRQHVIADLGVNYVQRIWLLAGHTADRTTARSTLNVRVVAAKNIDDTSWHKEVLHEQEVYRPAVG